MHWSGTRIRLPSYRDVKSSNILLDENWEAKISDFGLSKIGPANQSCTHVSTNVKGTFGYLDPEYFLTRRLTRKSDVYAFGVVLFEVLCGRPAVDLRLDKDQQPLALCAQRCSKEGTLNQIIDCNLRGQIQRDSLDVCVEIADKCLGNRASKRPTMADVVAKLECSLALQESIESSTDFEFLVDTGGVIIDNPEDSNTSPEENEVSIVENPIIEIMAVGKARGLAGQSGTFMPRIRKLHKAIATVTKGKILRRKKKGTYGTSNSTGPSPRCSLLEEIQIRQFSLPEIEAATNFSNLDHLLAYGRCSVVFKGLIDCGQTEVAIKEMKLTSYKSGLESFFNEVPLLSRINHLHVLPLIGFCCDDEDKLWLVSKYMPNGSLHDHLHRPRNNAPLPWNRRLQICIGVAQGLNYLHTGIADQVIIHGKVKPTKILLDENWIPKFFGFELSKLGTSVFNWDTYFSTLIPDCVFRERFVDMDPDFVLRGTILTAKSDVSTQWVWYC